MRLQRRRRPRAGFAACIALAAVACGADTRPPPSPDDPQPPAPDLTGLSVMVLPAQAPAPRSAATLDAELAYWLGDRAPRVQWVFPPALADALERTPALDIPLHALAVTSFHRAEVQRIGDPLFSDLRRLGALVDARYALLPVAASYVAREAGGGRVQLAAALIDTHGGRVLWFGVVGGAAGPPGDPAVTASAAHALASALFP